MACGHYINFFRILQLLRLDILCLMPEISIPISFIARDGILCCVPFFSAQPPLSARYSSCFPKSSIWRCKNSSPIGLRQVFPVHTTINSFILGFSFCLIFRIIPGFSLRYIHFHWYGKGYCLFHLLF